MLRTRTLPISFRLYASIAGGGLIAAFVAAVESEHDAPFNRVLGPLTVGWKGGVGDHLAYAIFVGLVVSAVFLASLLTSFRDADAEAGAELIHVDSVPLTRAPAGANYWPVIGVFAVATVLVGLAVSSRPLALAGAVVVGVTIAMWTLRAWAERATGDDETNLALYHQLVDPFRLPVMALLIIGVTVIGFSRVLLALPSARFSAVVFGMVALVVLLACVGIALRPRMKQSMLILIVFAFGVIVLASGIFAAAHGQREIEKHDVPTEEHP